MSIRVPKRNELAQIAESYGFELSEDEFEMAMTATTRMLASYDRIDQMNAPKLPVKYSRDSGAAPRPEENPYNAWAWRCSIKGASTGKLSGKRIALKDNICLAGMPMRNGSAVLEGYVPDEDATVVTRVLDAGGEITGKATCENFCFSGGGSHTSHTGPVRNPINPEFSTGGSSSGCAALLAIGEVDMAIGGDQGGSIRLPASWTGVVGLKPTFGLVPYTGIFPIESTLDHTGPMARSVSDCALLLEVIAGEDGLDPRQKNVKTAAYTQALSESIHGMRIAVVREGFEWEGASEQCVDMSVRAAASMLAELGAIVYEISVPLHRDGPHVWNGIAMEGTLAQMVRGNGAGWNYKGHYSVGLSDFYGPARMTRANAFPLSLKTAIMLGQYLADHCYGHYYSKSQNLSRALRAAYDEALKSADLLLMPTTPMRAVKIPPPENPLAFFGSALGNVFNTCPFDVTGHPAISVPCGKHDGLPIGLMLVGRHFEEATVIKAAHAFESAQNQYGQAKG